jgi:hypothetical protein
MKQTLIPTSLIISDTKIPRQWQETDPAYFTYVLNNRMIGDEIAYRPEAAFYSQLAVEGKFRALFNPIYWQWMKASCSLRGYFRNISADAPLLNLRLAQQVWQRAKIFDFVRDGYNSAPDRWIQVEAPSEKLEFELMDGHHRVAAAKALGKVWIPALCTDEDIEAKWERTGGHAEKIASYLPNVTEAGDPSKVLYSPILLPAFSSFQVRRPGGDRLDAIWRYLKDYDLKNKRVLDIGSHVGFFSLHFLRKGAQVLGVDRNPSAVEISKHHVDAYGYAGGTFRTGDFDSLANEEPFDIVLLLCVLHHTLREGGEEKVKYAAQEIGRLTSSYCFLELPSSDRATRTSARRILEILQVHGHFGKAVPLFEDCARHTTMFVLSATSNN